MNYTVSYNRLMTYERCPFAYKLQYVDRQEGKQRDTSAADRGSQIHEDMQRAIEAKSMLYVPKTIAKKREDLAEIIEQGGEAERELLVDADWMPAESEGKYYAIVDAIQAYGQSVRLIDWKTGKRFGNELKHANQVMFYAAIAKPFFPEAELFECRVVYLDQKPGNDFKKFFKRDELARVQAQFDKRSERMLMDRIFRPRPMKSTCRFCSYKEEVCPYAVS